ncbi:MAG: hypothetical protein IPJ77_19135 [Planctomycetes bacterium]|nr:hypothetical protein [Planctomycetota bacterium]
MHASVAPRRIVACGVRWGKTLCAAMEALAAALAPQKASIGWVVAPTYDLSERVFNQVALIAMTHFRHRVATFSEHERRLVLRNLGGGTSEIRGKTADNPVSLLGEGLNWVIVDEAARLKPSIWESYLSQRLLDKKGWAMLISTPRGKSLFFDLWRRGQNGADPDYESWNAPSWDNPLLDRQMIEAERERLPERVHRQEYGAEFLEGSGAVFRYVREAASGELEAPNPDLAYFAGLDLAKVEDYTVLTIMDRRCRVVYFDRFQRLDWGIQLERIKAACDRYNRALILVDSTGAGEPIYEALCAKGCRVDEYPFTSKSKNDLVTHLAMLFENKKITLPRTEVWQEAIDELEAFEFSVTDAGAVRTGAPGSGHDDIVVSVALAAWNARNAPGPPSFSRVSWNDLERMGIGRRI